ncbi:hypothetical protein PCASD_19515 [Puccinia coronata f. sp. avenae]|uniref:Uncharacterized protein n=1 Tax=Puccinia coronata f. sp. avenae TaxID=200324 RepID=A0A2N5TPQ9_9BASI|nr:hypothetical protein PCASD_19515 [Puccinia coronata f. sp. avenae]
MFKTTTESDLTKVDQQSLQDALIKEATWEIRRNDGCRSIHSTQCARVVPAQPGKKDVVCNSCVAVRKDTTLLTAINRLYADGDTLKHVRKSLMEADPFQEKRRTYKQVNLLATKIERATKKDDQTFWKVFAAQASAGKFDDLEPFKGLVMAVAVRNERERDGKSLNGVRFSPHFDDFMMTLAAISPRGAQFFRETFAGRSLRSQRAIRAKNSMHLEDGLSRKNFEHISATLKSLNYVGPLAAGSDQTVCLKTLRVHNDCIVGAQGGDVKFDSEENLKELTEKILTSQKLCSKLRAYTIQVPLPGIPTYVVALLASQEKETAADIVETHRQFLAIANESGLNILSLSADGAANELSAQTALSDLSDKHITFVRPKYEINIRIPLLGNPPRPLVAVQDPKHARKTCANQILSGARLLSFGKYWFSILHLAVILESDGTSLYTKDVYNCDKQDDGRAYRLFNEETMKISLEKEDCTGLAVYLFVMGEICDSWLNQTMNHSDRILSAYTSHFFLTQWHQYLGEQSERTKGVMNLDRNGISYPSQKILALLADSLLSLIISHREYYPNLPLMPWKHGTEACEHIFGWMRVILPNFTVLDARQMMPKIFTIVKSIMCGRVKMPNSEHVHSGYRYSFSEASHLDPKLVSRLSLFPDNQEIDKILQMAQKRANALIAFTGMQKIAGIKSKKSPDAVVSGENDGVSISITKLYYYKSTRRILSDEPDNINEAIAEAASLAGERHSLEHNILEQADEHDALNETIHTNSRMSIQNLLNPRINTSDDVVTMPPPKTNSVNSLNSLELITSNKQLNRESMTLIRHHHDSEILLHHGNERKRRRNQNETSSVQEETGEEPKKLDPRTCSKIVSLCVHDANAKQDPAGRMHRWNIPLQLDLRNLTSNSSVGVDFTAHALFTTGEVSPENPLEPGKFGVVIRKGSMFIGKILAIFTYKNGRHDYTRASDTRAKLSYLHVQLFYYDPKSPASLGYKTEAPDRHIFALIKTHDLIFLFRRTQGMNITQPDLTEACVWVPSSLRSLLVAMSEPTFIKKTEADLKKLKPLAKSK